MWEILEKHDEYRPKKDYERDYEYSHRGSRMGMKSSEHDFKKLLTEAFDCGFEEGYSKAMEEVEHPDSRYGERRMGR